MFHSILPPWMHEGGTDQLLERLRNEEVRDHIKKDFANNGDYENWVRNCGWENIIIASVVSDRNKELESRNMLEVAQLRNSTPEDAAFDLLVEEQANITMIVHWGEEADIIYGMQHPVQIVGSDGIFGGKPHPRLYGTHPRVLGEYVREKRVLTFPEAIRRMTGAPGQLLRLRDRGLLKEGYKADIVIFDPFTIKDHSTYDKPLQEPEGMHHVIVNGQVAVANDQFTGNTSGTVIRR